jgi:hypothetical protein
VPFGFRPRALRQCCRLWFSLPRDSTRRSPVGLRTGLHTGELNAPATTSRDSPCSSPPASRASQPPASPRLTHSARPGHRQRTAIHRPQRTRTQRHPPATTGALRRRNLSTGRTRLPLLMHLDTAAAIPRGSGAFLLCPLKANVAGSRRRTLARDETRASTTPVSGRSLGPGDAEARQLSSHALGRPPHRSVCLDGGDDRLRARRGLPERAARVTAASAPECHVGCR